MGYLEESILRSGSIYRDSSGQTFYIEEAILTNQLVVRDSSGRVVSRIERASNGVNLRIS